MANLGASLTGAVSPSGSSGGSKSSGGGSGSSGSSGEGAGGKSGESKSSSSTSSGGAFANQNASKDTIGSQTSGSLTATKSDENQGKTYTTSGFQPTWIRTLGVSGEGAVNPNASEADVARYLTSNQAIPTTDLEKAIQIKQTQLDAGSTPNSFKEQQFLNEVRTQQSIGFKEDFKGISTAPQSLNFEAKTAPQSLLSYTPEQLKAGEAGAALRTRNYLATSLGVTPSEEMVSKYNFSPAGYGSMYKKYEERYKAGDTSMEVIWGLDRFGGLTQVNAANFIGPRQQPAVSTPKASSSVWGPDVFGLVSNAEPRNVIISQGLKMGGAAPSSKSITGQLVVMIPRGFDESSPSFIGPRRPPQVVSAQPIGPQGARFLSELGGTSTKPVVSTVVSSQMSSRNLGIIAAPSIARTTVVKSKEPSLLTSDEAFYTAVEQRVGAVKGKTAGFVESMAPAGVNIFSPAGPLEKVAKTAESIKETPLNIIPFAGYLGDVGGATIRGVEQTPQMVGNVIGTGAGLVTIATNRPSLLFVGPGIKSSRKAVEEFATNPVAIGSTILSAGLAGPRMSKIPIEASNKYMASSIPKASEIPSRYGPLVIEREQALRAAGVGDTLGYQTPRQAALTTKAVQARETLTAPGGELIYFNPEAIVGKKGGLTVVGPAGTSEYAIPRAIKTPSGEVQRYSNVFTDKALNEMARSTGDVSLGHKTSITGGKIVAATMKDGTLYTSVYFPEESVAAVKSTLYPTKGVYPPEVAPLGGGFSFGEVAEKGITKLPENKNIITSATAKDISLVERPAIWRYFAAKEEPLVSKVVIKNPFEAVKPRSTAKVDFGFGIGAKARDLIRIEPAGQTMVPLVNEYQVANVRDLISKGGKVDIFKITPEQGGVKLKLGSSTIEQYGKLPKDTLMAAKVPTGDNSFLSLRPGGITIRPTSLVSMEPIRNIVLKETSKTQSGGMTYNLFGREWGRTTENLNIPGLRGVELQTTNVFKTTSGTLKTEAPLNIPKTMETELGTQVSIGQFGEYKPMLSSVEGTRTSKGVFGLFAKETELSKIKMEAGPSQKVASTIEYEFPRTAEPKGGLVSGARATAYNLRKGTKITTGRVLQSKTPDFVGETGIKRGSFGLKMLEQVGKDEYRAFYQNPSEQTTIQVFGKERFGPEMKGAKLEDVFSQKREVIKSVKTSSFGENFLDTTVLRREIGRDTQTLQRVSRSEQVGSLASGIKFADIGELKFGGGAGPSMPSFLRIGIPYGMTKTKLKIETGFGIETQIGRLISPKGLIETRGKNELFGFKLIESGEGNKPKPIDDNITEVQIPDIIPSQKQKPDEIISYKQMTISGGIGGPEPIIPVMPGIEQPSTGRETGFATNLLGWPGFGGTGGGGEGRGGRGKAKINVANLLSIEIGLGRKSIKNKWF